MLHLQPFSFVRGIMICTPKACFLPPPSCKKRAPDISRCYFQNILCPLCPFCIFESSVATLGAGGELAMACYLFELVCFFLGILAPVTYVLSLPDQWAGSKEGD